VTILRYCIRPAAISGSKRDRLRDTPDDDAYDGGKYEEGNEGTTF
jgi:hypothetical protein